jgi:micrococcal nuclease
MIQRLFLLCLLFLVVGCQPQKTTENPLLPVKVVRVVSGQTFEVLGMGDQPNLISQVKLIGIEVPDLRQRPWGEDAKSSLESLIGDQSVMLEFDLEAKDKIGRTLAYIWKDKLLLNEQMVRNGKALFIARSPNHKYDLKLERAQHWARLIGEGIWNPDKPMRVSPTEFRRANK